MGQFTLVIVIVKPFFLRYYVCVRLDLFLKISRLVKRRTVAQEMCAAGRVLVNGQEAKPAKEVKTGDLMTLRYSSRVIDLEIIGMPNASFRKMSPEELYKVKSETRLAREILLS
jgi:ribosomal 50S subunit-recycling heat shock protein